MLWNLLPEKIQLSIPPIEKLWAAKWDWTWLDLVTECLIAWLGVLDCIKEERRIRIQKYSPLRRRVRRRRQSWLKQQGKHLVSSFVTLWMGEQFPWMDSPLMALLHVLLNSMTFPIIKNPGAGWARPMYTWDVHRGIQKIGLTPRLKRICWDRLV